MPAEQDRPLLQLGYWLSSEKHDPKALVRNAARAEQAGFTHTGISDLLHPWTSQQGQSPFVWSVLGAIAGATDHLHVTTGVTAPIIRMHPAIVAHAATTAAVLLDGRFSLGVGTGERLNEHVIGQRWPRPAERRDMLAEAITIIRRLWSGDLVDHRGTHYTVEKTKLFTRPQQPPDLIVASASLKGARLAGEHGDGLLGVTPNPRHVEQFESVSGKGKRRLAQLHVCWAASHEQALDTAFSWWPNAALTGSALTELAYPTDFEQVLSLARPQDLQPAVVLGPDPGPYVQGIARFATVGFDEVYLHQIGPDQEGFLRFYDRELAPYFAGPG